jgi:hypothetical protein
MGLKDRDTVTFDLDQVIELLRCLDEVRERNPVTDHLEGQLFSSFERLTKDDPDEISKFDYERMVADGTLVHEIRRRQTAPGMHRCMCMFHREREGQPVTCYWVDEHGVEHEETKVQEAVGYCATCGGTGWCY